MARSPCRVLPRVREVDRVRHATETHNSVGLVPAPTAPHSPRADRCANSRGAPGGRVGVARPVDGPPETALNGDALIPKAKAPAGGADQNLPHACGGVSDAGQSIRTRGEQSQPDSATQSDAPRAPAVAASPSSRPSAGVASRAMQCSSTSQPLDARVGKCRRDRARSCARVLLELCLGMRVSPELIPTSRRRLYSVRPRS